MRNRYPGTCYKCGCYVPIGFGFFERHGKYPNGKTKWRVQCVKCCDGRTVKKTDASKGEKKEDKKEEKKE